MSGTDIPVVDIAPLAGGDIAASRSTGGRFVSTPHRVINRSGRNRLSMAYFFDPSMDTVIECLPTCEPATGDGLPERLRGGVHRQQNPLAWSTS